jgi:hypothetical protein
MSIPHTTPGTPGRVRTTKAAIIRRLAAIGALALTVVGLSTAVASAGSDESITTKRGSASFNDNTEIVTANDTLADKQGVQAFLFWNGQSVTVTDGNGANNSPNTRKLSIPEGTKVGLKLCYVDNGVVKKCSRPQSATA